MNLRAEGAVDLGWLIHITLVKREGHTCYVTYKWKTKRTTWRRYEQKHEQKEEQEEKKNNNMIKKKVNKKCMK